jgi:hypothetical protein
MLHVLERYSSKATSGTGVTVDNCMLACLEFLQVCYTNPVM